MEKTVQHRRRFLADTGLAAAAMICGGATIARAKEPASGLHVSINVWSVNTVRARDKQKANISFDEELAELAACGINGLEPGLGSADQVGPLAAQLGKHGLELRSIYTGTRWTTVRKWIRNWNGSSPWPSEARRRERGSS